MEKETSISKALDSIAESTEKGIIVEETPEAQTSLSEKRNNRCDAHYPEKDVREAVLRLKEELKVWFKSYMEDIEWMGLEEEIDEIFGEKLTK